MMTYDCTNFDLAAFLNDDDPRMAAVWADGTGTIATNGHVGIHVDAVTPGESDPIAVDRDACRHAAGAKGIIGVTAVDGVVTVVAGNTVVTSNTKVPADGPYPVVGLIERKTAGDVTRIRLNAKYLYSVVAFAKKHGTGTIDLMVQAADGRKSGFGFEITLYNNRKARGVIMPVIDDGE